MRQGRSVRKYTSEAAAAKAVADAGYDPYEKKLLSITAMNSLLGKKKFEDILGNLTFKPRGRPALVPKSDKRPAMISTAEEDFSVKESIIMPKFVNPTKIVTGL